MMQNSDGGGSALNKRMSRRALLRQAGAATAAVGLARLIPTLGKAAPAHAAPAGTVELTFMNVSRGMARGLGELAKKYENERGIKVVVDTPGPLDYPQKLLAAAQTNTMPDIFFIGGTAYAPYLKAGWALSLKPELEKGWKYNFTPVALDLAEWRAGNPAGVPPGIYAAPLEVATFQMLYNRTLFEKAKLSPNMTPSTVPQLVEVLKALKAVGIAPFTTSVEAIPILIQAFVSNWLTDKEIDDTHAGRLPWTSTAYKKAVQVLVDLNDAGLIFNSPLNWRWAEMEKSFYNVREVGMIFDGSWSVAVQRATAPDFTAYGSLRVPRAADAKHGQRSVGLADRNIAINAKGRRVEEALAFVKWMTDKEQEDMLMELVPLVPTNPTSLHDTTKLPPQSSAYAVEARRAQRVPTLRTQAVEEAITKGIQAVFLKKMTIDQVLRDADRAQKG